MTAAEIAAEIARLGRIGECVDEGPNACWEDDEGGCGGCGCHLHAPCVHCVNVGNEIARLEEAMADQPEPEGAKFLLDFTDDGGWRITCLNSCILWDGVVGQRYQFDLAWVALNVDGHVCDLPELPPGEILPTERPPAAS